MLLRAELCAVGFAALLATTACGDPLHDPIVLSWGGCTADSADGECELRDVNITAWASDAPSNLRWWIGEDEVEGSRLEVEEGLFTFKDPLGEQEHVTLSWGWPGEVSHSVQLRRSEIEMMRDEQHRARTDAAEPRGSDRALELANTFIAEAADADPLRRVMLLEDARSLLYDPNDPTKSDNAILKLLPQIKAAAKDAEHWELRCMAASYALHIGTKRQDWTLVDPWRRDLEECRSRSPDLAAEIAYYLAVEQRTRFHYEQALRLQKSAMSFATRHGTKIEMFANFLELEIDVQTARWDEAEDAIVRLKAMTPKDDPCAIARTDADVGYARLTALERANGALGDPKPSLLRALKAVNGKCQSVDIRNHVLIKLAYVAALESSDQLVEYVDAVDKERLLEKFQPQLAELEIRAAAVRDGLQPARALIRERLRTAGKPTVSRWRLHALAAELAAEDGDVDAQIDGLSEAERVLDALGRREQGAIRERWLGAFRDSALQLAELLNERDDKRGAACVLRRARRRGLLSEAEEAAPSSCDQPWTRDEDTAVFLVVPTMDERRWWVFVIVDNIVKGGRRVSSLDPKNVAAQERWWDQWDDTLSQTGRVHVLAAGDALKVGLHRAGWQGRPLAVTHPVTYGLDGGSNVSADGRETHATIVFSDADPLRELGSYRDDMVSVRETLREHFSQVHLQDSPSLESVLGAARTQRLLHVFGHGAREGLRDDAAVTGDSGKLARTILLLPDGDRLRGHDVLELDSTPPAVVLLGCELAYPDPGSWAGGDTLVRAFIRRGSSQVLASVGEIDARAAAKLGEDLYAAMDLGDPDLALALHKLWNESNSEAEEEPRWNELRVWTP